VVQRLLLRLDEQGLALSSPWQPRQGLLIAEALRPKTCATWTEKQKWAGCSELGEELAERWQGVKRCLSACKKLVKARILTVQQLRSASGRWLHIDDLFSNHRLLTADEYDSLTSWLDAADLSEVTASDTHEQAPVATRSTLP
jgi:hypothetical protein